MSTVASTHDDTLSQRSGSSMNERFQMPQEEDNEFRLSEKWLKKLFRDNYGLYYNTFELNEKLYLHYKGFKRIENMHLFPDLKCVYLEGNGFTKIEGFEQNLKLRALYIQENLFEKIENLNHLKDLHYLNLNDNYITTIENLSDMPNIGTLQIKKNKVGKNGLSDLMGLLEIPTLSVLDISDNLIEDEACVDEVFVKMPNLAVLYLKGNPVCKKIRNYKKTIIAKIPTLKYLDDSPVFPEDRRYAEAFAAGGVEKEREERKKVKQEKDDEHWKNHEAFREMIRKAKEEKKRKEEEKAKLEEEKAQLEEANRQDEPVTDNQNVHEEQEEMIQTTKQGVKEQAQKDSEEVEASKDQPSQENDEPPALEEVSAEQLAKEQESLKVQNLINQLAKKDGALAEEEEVQSNKGNKSIVDIDDVRIQNSASINLSVTSETSEQAQLITEDSQDQINNESEKEVEESEEEKHLDDSASEVDEESAKTEPGKFEGGLNDTEESQHSYSNTKTKKNDEEGEYLDELD